MANQNVGTLSTMVTADTSDFTTQIAGASTTVKGFSRNVETSARAVTSSSKGFRNGQVALQQLAFGVEDAASVYGTAGLSGAVRAAGNNVSQFASLIHPLAGVVAGFATAGLSIFISNMDKAAKATKDAAKAVQDFTNLDMNLDQNQRDRESRLGGQVDFGASSEALEGQRNDLKREMRKTESDMQREQEEIIALARPFVGDVISQINRSELTPQSAGESPFAQILGAVDGGDQIKVPEEVKERIREAERELFKLNNEMGRSSQQMTTLGSAIDAAREMENQERSAESDRKAAESQAAAINRQNDLREEAAKLEREITGELDPQSAKQQDIQRQLDERIKSIKAFGDAGVLSQEEVDAQVARAQESANTQLANAGGASGIRSELASTPAAIRGSAAAISSINRAATKGGPDEKTASNTSAIAKSSAKTAAAVEMLAQTKPVVFATGNIIS